MNDNTEERKAQRPEDEVSGTQPETSTEPGANARSGGDDLDSLRAENADLRDKLLRAMAELENFRRRAEREKADLAKYAISDFARDIVTIGDNLRRAIEAIPRGAAEQDPHLKTLVEGVEVTERELIKVFERHGVTRFDPLGEKFDPHVHEAMIKVDVPNATAETIVQVLHAGYMIGDRVLRPAAVIVAKGSPSGEAKQPPQAPPQAPQGQGGEGGKPEAPAAEGSGRAQGPQQAAPQSQSGGELRRARRAEGDPDVARKPDGTPRRGRDEGRSEKRPSSMTKPVTENSAPPGKEELISTFGKRLES